MVAPPQSLDAVFLLFPDPWPKNRHANRRFIGPDNLNRLARAMKSGAELRMASDVPPLATWMQKHTLADDRFAPHAGTESGQWPHRPAHWPTTRYEQKNLAKHPPAWLSFYRR
ncbi:MAG: hypothetical protein EBZ69_07640 [Alphaproteobacteria bacterium]|nr:hypothetical protein [Alphaproteobacteria bacterium]